MRLDTQLMKREADMKLAEAQREHARALRVISEIERIASGVRTRDQRESPTISRKNSDHPQIPATGVVANLRPSIIRVIKEKQRATLNEISTALHSIATRKQVARALYKMHTKDEIRIVRKQSGMTPALYAPQRSKKNADVVTDHALHTSAVTTDRTLEMKQADR